VHTVWAEAGEMEFDENGNIAMLSGIVQDITERKKVEIKLRQLSTAVQQSPATIVITDTQGIIEYVNPKFTETTGYTFEEAIGKNPRILKSGVTPQSEYEKMWETILSGKEWRGEFCNVKKNGETYWEFASISPITNESGIITNFIAVKEDITQRKKSQIELEVSRDQLRKLASRLEQIREEERKQIAQEIHDELGQQLTGIKMNIAIFQKKYANDSAVIEKLDYMKQLIDGGIQTVRNISRNLRPPILDELGLFEAIKWQVREFTEAVNIQCTLSLPDEMPKVNQEMSTGIFRIVQECITNIIRHADADSVTILLENKSNGLYLSIADNGRGITPLEIQDINSIGIHGMEERARTLGGSITISPVTPQGTKIEGFFPLEKQ
jgi:PAS domain S-box-containing protein